VRRALAGFVVLATALAALLAGGASVVGAQTTSTGAPPSTTGGAAGGVRGVTATTIKVAGLGDSARYGGADVGARARFQRANAAGGVHGRTVDYGGFTDEGGDPQVDKAAVAKLAPNGVFAVVPAVSGAIDAPTLVQQKVPYFGWALSSSFCGNLYGFGIAGCPFPADATSTAWPALVAKSLPDGGAGKTAAIVAENTPSGEYAVRTLSAAAKRVGLKVVYAKSSLTAPATSDFDPVMKELGASNAGKAPDAVFVVAGVSNVLGLQSAVQTAGYLGIFTDQLGYSPDFVGPSTGTSVFTQTAPAETAATNPAMKQLVADVQQVAPGTAIDQAVISGYYAADLFLAALQKAGRNLTSASLVRAANAKFTYEVSDTVGPTTFPAAHSTPTPCGALVASDGTAYTVQQPYTCGRVIPVK
jgi:ABC-type branched-subunit amino acid transport system substrate-binding protein